MRTPRLKRVYLPPDEKDGTRVLVDRLWPRGVRKEDARIALWLKEVAPSAALRTWFGHQPERFAEFRRRYLEELAGNPAAAELRAVNAREKELTLVYGAKDETHNQAVVLAEYLAGAKDEA